MFLKEHSFVFSVGSEWGRGKEGTGAEERRLGGEAVATSTGHGVTLGVRRLWEVRFGMPCTCFDSVTDMLCQWIDWM